MTTTDRDDLYQRARNLYYGFNGESRDGLRAVVDLALAERPAPTEWETLRAAALIMSDIAGVNPSRTESRLRDTAFRLEAEHAAAQAEAAADAARDALIEKAAQTIAYAIEPNDDDVSADYLWKRYLAHGSQERYRANARALADAGLLVDPEAEATA